MWLVLNLAALAINQLYSLIYSSEIVCWRSTGIVTAILNTHTYPAKWALE